MSRNLIQHLVGRINHTVRIHWIGSMSAKSHQNIVQAARDLIITIHNSHETAFNLTVSSCAAAAQAAARMCTCS